MKNCIQCGKKFYDKKHPSRKFCSLQCVGVYKRGKKYIKHKENPTSFKKSDPRLMNNKYRLGLIPINAIKKGQRLSPATEFKQGIAVIPPGVTLLWRGTRKEYRRLHYWVEKQLGKATACSRCGSIKNVDWANKSQQYLWDLSDWIKFCRSCHAKYDWNFRKVMLNV